MRLCGNSGVVVVVVVVNRAVGLEVEGARGSVGKEEEDEGLARF